MTKEENTTTIHHGDCLTVLRSMPDASVSAIVTDPPYGLSNTNPASVADAITKWVGGDREHVPTGRGFMGKSWDAFVPPPAVWDECLRVLKPGGHMVVFAGSRTQDLMGLSIRLAGFDIRDSVAWLYGSGFPKSLDVSKAIDKAAGAEREVVRERRGDGTVVGLGHSGVADITAPATDAAREWEGWGTALKPAHEPVIVARKPLEGTVAGNVLEHGTGALNIDGCRVGAEVIPEQRAGQARIGTFERTNMVTPERTGRWPANVVLDESQAEVLDQQSGVTSSAQRIGRRTGKADTTSYGEFSGQERVVMGHNDSGGASRFFYTAKASKSERPVVDGTAHPTVKPLAIMQWLIRLTTPPGGLVLDPFAGSGTTIEAAILEGFPVIGIEREADYLPLIQSRIDRSTPQG